MRREHAPLNAVRPNEPSYHQIPREDVRPLLADWVWVIGGRIEWWWRSATSPPPHIPPRPKFL